MRRWGFSLAVLACSWLPAAAQEQPSAPGPEGVWTGSIDWEQQNWPDTRNLVWTFTADGVFQTSDGYSGVWSQYGERVIWVVSVAPNSVYEMQFAGPDALIGQMHNREGAAGSVTMQRVAQ